MFYWPIFDLDLKLMCMLEWHSVYDREKQTKNWRTSEKRKRKPTPALQVSSNSNSRLNLLPRGFKLFLACKNLPRGFSILKTDQIIDHFRRVSHCLHYLLHTNDKTDKTGPAFNKYFFSKESFQTLHVAHKVGFYEGRSANVKAPAIEWIWAVKRNIWVGSKKFPTCLENIFLKNF